MCPKCKNFTNAPAGQKRRRCSYCGHIIDITKASCAVFDSPEMATAAVKEFNASRGGDEFERAVEMSIDKVRTLLPSETILAEDVAEKSKETPPAGKNKRLIRLLEENATDDECSLDRLAGLCPKYDLEWSWVEKQLTKLSNQGMLIFPRPWTVRVIRNAGNSPESEIESVDVSEEVLELLAQLGGKARLESLAKHFEKRGISRDSLEKSLNRLMKSGHLYEPNPGLVSLV